MSAVSKQNEAALTQAELQRRLSYDAETGIFTHRLIRRGAEAGAKSTGYVLIGVAGRVYAAHRLAWLYVHGRWPVGEIDHINGDPLDNRIANLRDVTTSLNAVNRRRTRGRPIVGATFHKGVGKWQVAFRRKYIGLYETKEEAQQVYQRLREHAFQSHTGSVS